MSTTCEVTDEHFEKSRKTTQQRAAVCSKDQHDESSKVENSEKAAVSRGIVMAGMGDEGLEQPADSSEKTVHTHRGDAESDALRSQTVPVDPDLTRLVIAWPSLPDAARRGILALLGDAAKAE